MRIRFFGAAGEGGADPGWKVGIAAFGAAGLALTALDAPEGRLTVDLVDPTLTSVRIGAGPTSAAGEGLAWSWDAELVEIEGDTGASDTAPPDTAAPDTAAPDGEAGDPAKGAPGCGCASGSRGSGSPLLVAGLLALVARRARATARRGGSAG